MFWSSFSPGALSESSARLSASVPALNLRMSRHLTERCCRFLRSAAEVPRLYRRTNKVRGRGLWSEAVGGASSDPLRCEQEVPVRASAYVDNAVQPLHQLLNDSRGLVAPPTVHEWLRTALSECTQR